MIRIDIDGDVLLESFVHEVVDVKDRAGRIHRSMRLERTGCPAGPRRELRYWVSRDSSPTLIGFSAEKP